MRVIYSAFSGACKLSAGRGFAICSVAQKMAQPGYPQQYAASPISGEAFSKVELSISCSNLKDLDTFSRSDPAVFVYEARGREWLKLGRTEVVDNNLNPKVGHN